MKPLSKENFGLTMSAAGLVAIAVMYALVLYGILTLYQAKMAVFGFSGFLIWYMIVNIRNSRATIREVEEYLKERPDGIIEVTSGDRTEYNLAVDELISDEETKEELYIGATNRVDFKASREKAEKNLRKDTVVLVVAVLVCGYTIFSLAVEVLEL